MLRVAVCVSGGGTNLQAIIDRVNDGTITNTELVLVISNKPDAYALTRAADAGIDSLVIEPKSFASRDLFGEAMIEALRGASVNLVVLGGYLVILPENLVKAYEGRMINIHPSLIPSHCGAGYYGLKVHESVLARGNRVTGATVHFVDEGTDSGPIILQKAVDVMEEDTPETLQRRVMEQAEWEILPRAIDLIANDRIRIVDGKVRSTGK